MSRSDFLGFGFWVWAGEARQIRGERETRDGRRRRPGRGKGDWQGPRTNS